MIIIPARMGSFRLPGKPLVKIKHKYLIQQVFSRCCEAERGDIKILTDTNEIGKVIDPPGKVYVVSRSCMNGTERIGRFLIDRPEILDDEIIINVQGDMPFISPKIIQQICREKQSHPEIDVITMCSTTSAPNGVCVVTHQDGDAIYFSRLKIPHQLQAKEPPKWKQHIGIYAYSKKIVCKFLKLGVSSLEEIENLEQLRFIENGMQVRVVSTFFDPGPEINTPEDVVNVNN